jgi:hypothetical protein
MQGAGNGKGVGKKNPEQRLLRSRDKRYGDGREGNRLFNGRSSDGIGSGHHGGALQGKA